jgi:DNA invertase Pin-like site-specific DNA recombinase
MLAVAASMFLVWACDRMARSTRHLLEVLDELKRIGVEFVSFRENLDTAGPLGRAIMVIIGAIAELERSLIVERVRVGMRRARLDGQRIGRTPLVPDSAAIHRTVSTARASDRSPEDIAFRRPRTVRTA